MGREEIVQRLQESTRIHRVMSETLADDIAQVANIIAQALESGTRQVFLFGVGGSAAVCESISQDLKGLYKPSDHITSVHPLTAETGLLTQILNDHSAEDIFSWQIGALARREDVAIAISTSGDSASVVQGARVAKDLGLIVIALTGQEGGEVSEYSQQRTIRVPSLDAAHIEDAFSTIGHTICQEVQDRLAQD